MVVATVSRSAITASPSTDGKRFVVPTTRASSGWPAIRTGSSPWEPAAAARSGVTMTGTGFPSVACRGRNLETTSFESRKRTLAEPPEAVDRAPPVPSQAP